MDNNSPENGAGREFFTMKKIMAIAFCAGLLVRIVYLFSFRNSPFFDGLIVDAQWHDEWASGWADGTWNMGGRAFFRAPLYPFFLSLIYRIFGRDLLAARIVQMVIGSGTIAALAGCGWRIGGKKMALWTSVIAVLYGPLLFFDAEFLIPNLLVALLAWMLFFTLARPSPAAYLLAAGFLGFASISRPNALVLIPIVCIFIRSRIRREPGMRGSILVWFIILSLVPSMVVTAINLREEGAFVFIASQGGVNLYAGNNPEATGRTVIVPEMRHRQTGWSNFVKLSHDVAQELAGRELDSGEVSNVWTGKAWDWIKSNPRDAAILTLKKIYFAVNAHEIANNRDPYIKTSFPLNILLWKMPWFAFPWGIVLPLALIGAILGWRHRESGCAVRLLAGWTIVYAVFLVPFFITARFRMGMVPPLILLAAFAASRGRKLLGPVPLVAGVAALLFVNTELFEARGSNQAQEKAKLGAALLLENRLGESRRMLEEAVELDPNAADYAYLLGQVHFLEGRYEEALRLFRHSIELDPTNYRVMYYIGNALMQLGNYDEAIGALEKAVELYARDGDVWGFLGRAYERVGNVERAIEAYRRALEYDPANEQWCLDLGYLHQQREDLHAAIDTWRRGVERNPGSYPLRYNLAMAYAQTDQFLNALEEIDTVLNLRPDDENAKRLRTWITQKMGRYK